MKEVVVADGDWEEARGADCATAARADADAGGREEDDARARRCLDGGGTLGMLNLVEIRYNDIRVCQLQPLTSTSKHQDW